MLSPIDLSTIPSLQDIANVRMDISRLEVELQSALGSTCPQEQIDDLERRIFERKAWISPAQRLPLDLLSIIFTECSKQSSLAPLTLQAVCRHWRQSLFDTPTAWSFAPIGFPYHLGLVRAFLERNAPTPLHIRIPPSRGKNRRLEVMKYAGRIQCLTTDNLDHILGIKCPLLQKLKLGTGRFPYYKRKHGMYPSGNTSLIDVNRFPNLRTLCVSGRRAVRHLPGTIQALTPSHMFPPLVNLKIDVTESTIREFLLVIANCAQSLTRLRVCIHGSEDLFTQVTLDMPLILPRLRNLIIQVSKYTKRPNLRWPKNLLTPALETYRQKSLPIHSYSIHNDTKTVTHLKLYHFPDPSGYPNVRLLNLPFSLLSYAVAYLAENPGSFPYLESIQYEEEDQPSSFVMTDLRNFNENSGRSVNLE